MSNSNTKNTDAIAQAFGVIGDGSAEVKWVKDYTQGACTIKLGESRWGVVLPENDETVKLHEMGHVLFSSFEASAISSSLGPLGNYLVAVIEDARIDTRAGEWYRSDLKGDHGARLRKEGAGASDTVVDAVTAFCYDLPVTLGETGSAITARFGRQLGTVQHSKDPWATARLAYEIECLYKDQDQLEPEPSPQLQLNPEPAALCDGCADPDPATHTCVSKAAAVSQIASVLGKVTHASAAAAACGCPACNKGGEDEGEGGGGGGDYDEDGDNDGPKPDRKGKVGGEPDGDGGSEGGGGENDLGPELEAEWERIKGEASIAVRVAREEIAKKSDRVDTTGDGSHDVEILNVEQEPVKLGSVSHLVLDETVGLGRQVKRHGQPTPDVWKLGLYGDTRVFTKPPNRKGRVVVLVDLSASMCCWCEVHKEVRGGRGWLAFQAAATITAKLPDATLLGFCSSWDANYIVPLSSGNQPVCRNSSTDINIPGGNPDCAALEYLRTLLEGDLEGTTAIVISDGAPVGPAPLDDIHMQDHTKALAHQLAGSGVKFVSVLVNTVDLGFYPSDVVIEVGNESDLLRLTKAIEAIIGGQ